jgi:hypothetical protein
MYVYLSVCLSVFDGHQVLEQFLSTSISPTNELAESYLVGNRLVTFLSVVLPTHPEYFAQDEQLTALRHHSESQLEELLQYMEELGLLIDELQYNRYILQDLDYLTPDETDANLTATTAEIDTSSDYDNDDYDGPDNHSRMTDTSMASIKFQQTVARVVADSVAQDPPPPPPLTRTHGHVVPSNSNTSTTTTAATSRRLIRPESPELQVRIMANSNTRRHDHEDSNNNNNNTMTNQPLYDDSSEWQMDMSWDASFSDFARAEGSRGADERSTPSRMDVLISDKEEPGVLIEEAHAQIPPQQHHATPTMNRIPKLKQPPAVPPRSTRAKAATSATADAMSKVFACATTITRPPTVRRQTTITWKDLLEAEEKQTDEPPPTTRTNKPKDDDDDPFAMKTRIEERWERAERDRERPGWERAERDRGRERPRWERAERERPDLQEWRQPRNLWEDPYHGGPYTGEETSMMVPQKNLLQHFKGCVRCLVD